MKIVCVGAGSMAESMIHGWINKRILKPEDISVMNKSDLARLEFLRDEYGVNIVEAEKTELRKAHFVLLAMKPKDAAVALGAIKEHLTAETVILSVVAGVSIASIQKHSGLLPVARAMPNTSARIGKSATGVAWSKQVTLEKQHELRSLLSSIGGVTVVKEEQLHAVTGVAGSGPAYVYYMAEAMTEAAIEEGLSLADATKLVRQTFDGAAEMLQHSNFGELRQKVTSPNGTTAAGVAALDNHQFKKVIHACVKAATNRSQELGREFD
ncbi:pyrroline-5-carboxylate reductase [Planococcus sp. N028]|uniref:Pyrroline-5-carboxylate reductase n=2 Tax=Planococcus shixiaomingii TaxID=3058393 RepID=A0ABT8MYV7_9BACL|nr:pyrroline-5-carboxylate reductase [Planococcus sp. N022]MDN7240530.1 pyrroline-5-carboxylate reductase [Planococcus sp. N028]WKA56423.1 pyrroline-5-carboxylate reductase [Planococcus sp. N022]